MPIIVSDSGKDFEKPSVGWHQAVCTNVYGPFKETYEWQGKPITAQKVVIMFELSERIKEGDFANQRFTASLGEKSKLRPFLESWKGKAFTPEGLQAFDLELLIGVNCQVNLIEKDRRGGGKTIIIASIGPRRQDLEKMDPELPRDFAPKWIKDIIEEQKPASEPTSEFTDDIQF
jgi:hypothetical protein